MLKVLCIALHLCTTISGSPYTIDGDTISFDSVHVRIFGLDAEETYETHGMEARLGLFRLVQVSDVTCNLTGERSHERYIGRCYNKDGDIAAQMIAQGLALDCPRYSGGVYRKYETEWARLKLAAKSYCWR